MRCFRLTANRLAFRGILLSAVAFMQVTGLSARGQEPASHSEASLQVSVRSSHGEPLARAAVHLRREGQEHAVDARTDAQGKCRFQALHPGRYTVSAERKGFAAASFGPFAVEAGGGKNISLKLPATAPVKTSSEGLKFFDQPQFTIAGVSDSTSLGGHGSNTVAPTKEELARQVVALGGNSAAPSAASNGNEQALRKAADSRPSDFVSNRRLGDWLLAQGRAREAAPYLQQASRLKPADYQSSYQLARAYADAGQYDSARAQVQSLLAGHDRAELHHLLADVEEKRNQPLAAAQEYERAARLDLSETNFFDWGAELLTHRAAEPAAEVFRQGNRLFPNSVRMLLGLGAAWFARGSYERAAAYFCQASDLEPAAPQPYLFLGQVQEAEAVPQQETVDRLARFARLRPEDARANYYYALSLWRAHARSGSGTERIEALLQKAVHLNPEFGAAYMRLGMLYAERKQYGAAVPFLQKAIATEPRLADAHYQLAQVFMRTGDRTKAQAALQAYDQLQREQKQETEQERQHMEQFVYTLRGSGTPAPPH